MTERNPDNPLPESDDNPSFEDVSSKDENELTVILPEELTEDVGQEVTEEVPAEGSGKSGEVFVLLPDGDDSKIPMVETQEVPDVTEEIEGPRLASVYESATSDVGLRSENPIQAQADEVETEIDPYAEPTEQYLSAEHPTETMSAGDLDDFASEVADEMIVSEGGAPSSHLDDDSIGYDEEEDYYDEEPAYRERPARRPRRRRSGFGKLVLSLAALIAIAATGVHFFPEYFGLDPSFDLKTFVMEHVESLMGGPEVASGSTGTGDPGSPDGGGVDSGGPDGGTPPLALAAQETFKTKFRQAIELGFGGEGPR